LVKAKSLFALRWQGSHNWVIASDWANLCSSTWGANLIEEVNIYLVVVAPLTRNIVLVVNGLDWANWLTRTAVNALIRMDVEHAVTLVDAVNGALVNTCLVFDVNAWKGDYVGQSKLLKSAPKSNNVIGN
jgi:hypothetical protein